MTASSFLNGADITNRGRFITNWRQRLLQIGIECFIFTAMFHFLVTNVESVASFNKFNIFDVPLFPFHCLCQLVYNNFDGTKNLIRFVLFNPHY